MASMILERVAKQPDSGTGTMPIVYPPGVHNVYLDLGAGVYDLIISWNGRARVEAIHMWNREWASKRRVIDIAATDIPRERRGLVRISSEKPQWVYFSATGALDANARLAIQVIPANLTLDFEISS